MNEIRSTPFLTAWWRRLVMLNYPISPDILRPWIPPGTELDTFDGQTFVSLVAFRFLDTRVKGIAIPWHRHFDEVNLRFYVVRKLPSEIRRGVVFIREFVPHRAIAFVARAFFNESYTAVPMTSDTDDPTRGIFYRWKLDGWHSIALRAKGPHHELTVGSMEEFITEHYWGYGVQRNGSTLEYRVEHPRWRYWEAEDARFIGNAALLYGDQFAPILSKPPTSAILAEGSEVSVYSAESVTPPTTTPLGMRRALLDHLCRRSPRTSPYRFLRDRYFSKHRVRFLKD
jgi:uncharacterized protein YqjF (DUF2071 family)